MTVTAELAGMVPARVDDAEAPALLDRDGAVILTGRRGDPDELVVAAATMLGTRLRAVFPARPSDAESGQALGLHSDGANVVVDVHGRLVQLRHPDEDYLFIACAQPAASGGASVLVDGYRLLEALRRGDPALYTFLTTVDVDFFGDWTNPTRGVPHTPLCRRFVEHTRSGRLAVRAGATAAPAPREPRAAQHRDMIAAYGAVLAAQAGRAPRFRLAAGELLVVDNYRMLHARDAFSGRRRTCVLTVLSADAH